jgi:hypothetical protein
MAAQGGSASTVWRAPAPERQDLKLAAFLLGGRVPPDQPAEQETAGRARDQHVAVHRAGELVRGESVEPQLVASAIIPDAAADQQSDLAGTGSRRHHHRLTARGVDSVRPQYGGDRHVGAGGQFDQIGGLDVERAGDAGEPAHRDGAGAGFEPADRLRRGGRVAAVRHVLKRHVARAADFPDASDHCVLPNQMGKTIFLQMRLNGKSPFA